MTNLVHILTEAILDYEDGLLLMERDERERYRPAARERARFLADRLDALGVTKPGAVYFAEAADEEVSS